MYLYHLVSRGSRQTGTTFFNERLDAMEASCSYGSKWRDQKPDQQAQTAPVKIDLP